MSISLCLSSRVQLIHGDLPPSEGKVTLHEDTWNWFPSSCQCSVCWRWIASTLALHTPESLSRRSGPGWDLVVFPILQIIPLWNPSCHFNFSLLVGGSVVKGPSPHNTWSIQEEERDLRSYPEASSTRKELQECLWSGSLRTRALVFRRSVLGVVQAGC